MDELLLSTLRLSVPLIFAALGGLLSERSGIANVALEGTLLFSAFSSAAGVSLTGDLYTGVLVGLLVGTLTGALFSAVCVWGRGDQIVIGTAFNLLALGLIPILTKWQFGHTGSTPSLPLSLRFQKSEIFFGLAILATLGCHYIVNQTRFGLRLTSAGENPHILSTRGISTDRIRWMSTTVGSLLTSMGGIYIGVCQASGYTRNMVGGRGFLALAALIFGAWKPYQTLAACLFFAFTDALQIQMQISEHIQGLIPSQVMQVFPYLICLTVLTLYSRRIRAPAAINKWN